MGALARAGCPQQKAKPACPAHRTCSSCLDDPSCAWCGMNEQCFPRQAQSDLMCSEWHDLTCPMIPISEAFAPPQKPCAPRGAFAGPWDLALLQEAEGEKIADV